MFEQVLKHFWNIFEGWAHLAACRFKALRWDEHSWQQLWRIRLAFVGLSETSDLKKPRFYILSPQSPSWSGPCRGWRRSLSRIGRRGFLRAGIQLSDACGDQTRRIWNRFIIIWFSSCMIWVPHSVFLWWFLVIVVFSWYVFFGERPTFLHHLSPSLSFASSSPGRNVTVFHQSTSEMAMIQGVLFLTGTTLKSYVWKT